jgi:hypothetical protein
MFHADVLKQVICKKKKKKKKRIRKLIVVMMVHGRKIALTSADQLLEGELLCQYVALCTPPHDVGSMCLIVKAT